MAALILPGSPIQASLNPAWLTQPYFLICYIFYVDVALLPLSVWQEQGLSSP